MSKLEFPLLTADEILVRQGNVSSNGTGCSLLLYKDARVDMKLLDQVVGPYNWQNGYEDIKGVLYAWISIYDEEKNIWIKKMDCGTETVAEKEKGESSDAYKRAGFRWGIGRELYTAPFIWIPASKTKINGKKVEDSFNVDAIEYEDRKISYLVIKNKKGNVVFVHGKPAKGKAEKVIEEVKAETKPAPKKAKKAAPKTLEEKLALLKEKCASEGVDTTALAKCYKKNTIEELLEHHIDNALEKWDQVLEACVPDPNDIPED